MRHGWKTRIEERRYFEEKKFEREQLAMMKKIAIAELHEKIREELREAKGSYEIN